MADRLIFDAKRVIRKDWGSQLVNELAQEIYVVLKGATFPVTEIPEAEPAVPQIIDNLKFTSRRKSDGKPTTLSGGAVACRKKGSGNETTAGLMLTVDFDGVEGLNDIDIDVSDDFYHGDEVDFQIVVTAGTVAGTEVKGETVGRFYRDPNGGFNWWS